MALLMPITSPRTLTSGPCRNRPDRSPRRSRDEILNCLLRLTGQRQGAALCADDALRKRRTSGSRPADSRRPKPTANARRVAAAERRRRESSRVDLDHGNVRVRIASNDLRLELSPVEKPRRALRSHRRRRDCSLRASWIAANPVADTSDALGDTIHLAATITDKNGAVILGAQPAWTSENPSIAKVEGDGTVIVKAPGLATIIAAVDGHTARTRIVVRQRVTAVRPAKDSTVSVPEGEQRAMSILAFDSRGHIVRGRAVAWTSDDTTIAVVDSAGAVTGRNLGRTLVHAAVDGLTATQSISVFATPATVEAADGASQHANAGTTLPRQLVVRVLSKKGRPVSGATVRFRALDGMGSAEPTAATSDDEGRARARWTLGDLAGVQHLLVTVDGADSSIAITADADPVASNTRLVAMQEHVTGIVDAEVSESIGLRVTDATGRILSGVPVTWTALDGGSAHAVATRTDSAGEARARWVLGSRAGAQHIRAQVGSGRSVPPLTIGATAQAGPPRAVTVVSGDHQDARVGTELSRPVVLRVADSAGNPVADAALALAISAGSLADSSVRTDSTGKAAVRWRMGRETGAHALSACDGRRSGHAGCRGRESEPRSWPRR